MRGVTDSWRETLLRAYPQSDEGRIIGTCSVGVPEGPCGGELWVAGPTVTGDRWAQCRTCKTSALVDWWLAQMPPEQHEWLPMRALRWHLLLHVGRRVSDVTIRSWARDPEILPTRQVDAAGEVLLTGGTEIATGRAEYRVRDVLELAESGRNWKLRARFSADVAIPA